MKIIAKFGFASVSLLLLMFVCPIGAQEHAPALDTCQADAMLWGAQDHWAEDSLQNQTEFGRPFLANWTPEVMGVTINTRPLPEVMLRAGEMSECSDVAQPPEQHADNALYGQGWRFYQAVIDYREKRYIERHHLLAEVIKEDAAEVRK